MNGRDILRVLKHQRDNNVDGSVYKLVQCEFSYNSNRIEGSTLSKDQTRLIFERGTVSGYNVPIDDILETLNHFRAFDYLLDNIDRPLDESMLFNLHAILKEGTSDSKNPVMSVGGYKLAENTIGSLVPTASPDDVPLRMQTLLDDYNSLSRPAFDDLLGFHVAFERIHPFSDGNGRVGRLVLFKECLANDIIPFIITDDLKAFYIRGLQMWSEEKGFLRDTCLAAQDRFTERCMPLAESYWIALGKTMGIETLSDNLLCPSNCDANRNERHRSQQNLLE